MEAALVGRESADDEITEPEPETTNVGIKVSDAVAEIVAGLDVSEAGIDGFVPVTSDGS